MILGSHNSWSYLPPKKWWLRPFAFMAKCQKVSIRQQYENFGVRCFDLRIRYTKWKLQVVHGFMVYNINTLQLLDDLEYLNSKGDCFVRVVHEVKSKKQWEFSKPFFKSFCYTKSVDFPNIKWWCGRNLYNWNVDYDFGNKPRCTEKYASVCAPRLIDDWCPWIYARINNANIRQKKYEKDEILLIDYVDIL